MTTVCCCVKQLSMLLHNSGFFVVSCGYLACEVICNLYALGFVW